MKLIFIYGPPAVGKLTVAKELARLTKYKIFHNHDVIELVNPYLKFGTDNYWELLRKIRLKVITAAAEDNSISIIFTNCYANPEDNKFVKQLTHNIKKYKGQICFVYLICDEKELLTRVEHESRREFSKIKSAKTLKHNLKRAKFTKIPFVKSLIIDNTKIPPKKAAQMIKEHYIL